ncbi:Hypothetical predicted protein [Mytilus galloprovincialis]|uniref:Peptidase M3A/M3B catalytic domain-containing protein n=1 Tax=Mytilus galloprovincialis TaxID=29158 RepID=A0A8B6FN77_MYTGA|nr:Hypothetical predicted protein [Mytilus galloprovincialis]
MSTNDRRKYYDKVGRRNTHTHNFAKKVRICMDLFEHYVEDVNIIEQLPQSLVYMMADYPEHYEKGPWQVELYDPIYSHFMSHCPCRITRWNIWYAKVNVSSQYHSEQFLNNNETISDVRAQRWGLANKLGYANFAEMVQHRTMAGGVNHVIEVLETIKTVAYPSAQQELATLQDYANNREFFQGELKVWDYAYYKTQREKDIVGSIADRTIPKTSANPKHPGKPWYDDACDQAIDDRKKSERWFNQHPTQDNLNIFVFFTLTHGGLAGKPNEHLGKNLSLG